MDSERFRKIEDVFQSALDLPPAERERFIRGVADGDADLISEVAKLVARYENEETFLESPVWTDSRFLHSQVKREIAESIDEELSPAADSNAKSFAGRRVGAYRLTDELGKGGMGVVYLAERADGEFKQKVAVKLIKRGMDTDFILKRFRFERQILANLNHPNIARLLDGGTTNDGSPYFVMEFVEGAPVLAYCRAKNLGLREKLELFGQICSAIAYAHRRKIIHRDIKPGNILVSEDGAPKLLDFGIAKILDPDSIHESIAPTATAMRLMTPEYASPEQARGEDITTASDQYSLGVLLYELITGARPYEFSSRAPHEIARVICEEIPSQLSSGAFGKLITENGDFPFDADFCRKLDRIVLKTLRKNPSQRYVSVDEFAADINRFLRNETVRAEAFAGEQSKIELAPPLPPAKIQNETSADDAAAIQPIEEIAISPRRKGVRQGVFLIILAVLSIPIFTALIVSTEIPPILQFFTFIVLLFGGVIRVAYALMLEPSRRKQLPARISASNTSEANASGINRLPAANSKAANENRRPSNAEIAAEKKSIAVLPFKNLNTLSEANTESGEFLSVGLADALVTRLSNVRRFAVRPTSSVLRFGGADADSFAAGRELNVNFVLDGNIL